MCLYHTVLCMPLAAGLQQSGSGVGVASTECDDYDMDSEEAVAVSSQQLPDSEEARSLSQQTDSGYGSGSSLPLSDNRAESPGSHVTPSLPTHQEATAVSEGGSCPVGSVHVPLFEDTFHRSHLHTSSGHTH